jgi:hypothetical protein
MQLARQIRLQAQPQQASTRQQQQSAAKLSEKAKGKDEVVLSQECTWLMYAMHCRD